MPMMLALVVSLEDCTSGGKVFAQLVILWILCQCLSALKTWLVTKKNLLPDAKQLFAGSGINVASDGCPLPWCCNRHFILHSKFCF